MKGRLWEICVSEATATVKTLYSTYCAESTVDKYILLFNINLSFSINMAKLFVLSDKIYEIKYTVSNFSVWTVKCSVSCRQVWSDLNTDVRLFRYEQLITCKNWAPLIIFCLSHYLTLMQYYKCPPRYSLYLYEIHIRMWRGISDCRLQDEPCFDLCLTSFNKMYSLFSIHAGLYLLNIRSH